MVHRNRQEHIYLVTASVHGGKTTYLSQLSKLLTERDLHVIGFLCPGSFDKGERSGFKLENIANAAELAMASTRSAPGWTPYRRFWFNPEAFRVGREWIVSGLKEDPDVLIIDEVGPMELEGMGWAGLLNTVGSNSIPVQIWNVREKLISEVMQRWSVPAVNVIRIENVELQEATRQISEIVKRNRTSKKYL